MKGHATGEGTAAFKERFKDLAESHFRQKEDLWFSSVGIGSYLGDTDDATDRLYEESLKEAVLSGVNVIDSAVNYRSQRSERAFGRAISDLIQSGHVKREELIICTKGGFIPFEGDYPQDPMAYIKKTYIDTNILKPEDIAEGCHAMTPAYLEDQLQKSLGNLGVETIDIYYLHNPETQLAEVDRKEFLKRLGEAFKFLEKKVSEGKIKMYGTATWNGYRVPQENDGYLSIQEMVMVAREVAGPGHHFKAVQLPINLAMPEGWVFPNQRFGPQTVSFLAAAVRLNLAVIASASLLQARLAGQLPDFLDQHFKNLSKSSQRAIQFTRSVPGITTALVGMKNKSHVRENMETAKVPTLSENELFLMFQQAE